jgi:hypothetical protein
MTGETPYGSVSVAFGSKKAALSDNEDPHRLFHEQEINEF